MKLPTHMSRDEFIARFGGVYEHSPHFAGQLYDRRAVSDAPYTLGDEFRRTVDEAEQEAKLALIRAHPDLANRIAMSAESTNEQRGAGLTNCTPEEFSEFQTLNDAYKAKFGFPFIIAVRGLDRAQILAAFRERVNNDENTEFTTALAQIHRIAQLRLNDLF